MQHTDQQLLADFAQRGSEAAFAELVARHTNLVYSAALRQTGSPDQAQDIAQSVFTDLARKARTLARSLNTPAGLVPWLFRSTRYAALTQLRNDRRREWRERQVMPETNLEPDPPEDWDRIRPVLDQAMSNLGEEDRTALLLRFFNERDLRSVGAALGVSDDAAQKRISRALEKLRAFLAGRGVATTVAALAAGLSVNAVQSAPAGIAAALTSASLAGAAAGGSILAAAKLMIMTNIKLGAICAIAAAGVAVPLAIQHQSQVKLREEIVSLRQQSDQLGHMSEENVRLSNLLAQAEESRAGGREQLTELLRLRAEVASLRKQSGELARALQDNVKLRTALGKAIQDQTPKAAEDPPDEAKQRAIAKLNDAKYLVMGSMMFAHDNGDQFPQTFEQISAYLKSTDQPSIDASQYEIVYEGALGALTNASATIVVREKQAFQTPNGAWARTYGFADGHAEVHVSADGNFEVYERKNMVSLK